MKPETFYHLAGRIGELARVFERADETLGCCMRALEQTLQDPERTEREDCTRNHAAIIKRGLAAIANEMRVLSGSLGTLGEVTEEPADGVRLERP